jgi:DNA-binding LytR/AlgR family response regulator
MQIFVVFHVAAAKYITLMTLKEVLELLSAESFIQTHKSYVAARDKVDLIREHELVIGPHCIPVSSRMRSRIIHELTQ